MAAQISSEQVYDIVGLGFGPANLGIGIAMTEKFNLESPEKLTGLVENPSLPTKRVCFIEAYDEFKWHPGMLLPDARMQVNFLKDLVTLRNPMSPFTFVNYLHSSDRLVNWINRGSVIPNRKEFSDYLSWAADESVKRGVQVKYGEVVIGVDRIQATVNGAPEHLVEVISKVRATGETRTRYGRDFLMSPGGAPDILPVMSMVKDHDNLFHSADYINSISRAISNCCSVVIDGVPMPNRPLRVAVVGSGQSAAEVAIHVTNKLNSLPLPTPAWVEGSQGVAPHQHQVDMVIRKGSLHSFDGSRFANEVFDPENTDLFFARNATSRRKNIGEYLPTNYGVANPGTLECLFELIYTQKTEEGTARRLRSYRNSGGAKTNIRGFSDIVNADFVNGASAGDMVTSRKQRTFAISVRHMLDETLTSYEYDIVILATGYKRNQWSTMLRKSEELSKYYGIETDKVELLPFLSGSGSSSPNVYRPEKALERITISTPGDQSDSSSDSSLSTPLTSPGPSTLGLSELPHLAKSNIVGISRGYRLIPKGEFDGSLETVQSSPREPRIYLQSMEENTHGIGDTLLSVVGIRATEVLGDMYPGEY